MNDVRRTMMTFDSVDIGILSNSLSNNLEYILTGAYCKRRHREITTCYKRAHELNMILANTQFTKNLIL